MNRDILHTVFEETAQRYPDRLAIEHGRRQITFRNLNKACNGIARRLQSLGIAQRFVVGLFLESGIPYVAGVIGIMKAGGIFMPLDIESPENRLAGILEMTRPSIVITGPRKVEQVRALFERRGTRPCIAVIDDDLNLEELGHDRSVLDRDSDDGNPAPLMDADQGSYIVCTSGSTGEPKAILGCHKGLSHFIRWEIGEFGIDAVARVSQLAPVTFDASLRDFFAPLVAGGTVCIPEADVWSSARRLVEWIARERLTLVHCVPSLFRLMTRELQDRADGGAVLPDLRYVLVAGEALYGRDVDRWMDLVAGRIELVNLYGPTETTLAKTFHRITERPEYAQTIVPIGKPIADTDVLIIQDDRMCGIGEVGEIYMKTPFMTKGYYNDPELTQKSFVQNPLNRKAVDIIYRTGDMGSYLPDGSVEFVGRLDNQVKVNGIRVEPAEVEKALMALGAIEQAVVVPHSNREGENTLACYYTEKRAIDPDQVRRHLCETLPAYMVPSFYVRLDALPLNSNGKIDRKALPRPEVLLYEGTPRESPTTVTEGRLEAIWKEVLELSQVGVATPFLEIGGNSLKAMRIVSRVFRNLGVEITLRDFFENSTIRELAVLVDCKTKTASRQNPPVALGSHHLRRSAQRQSSGPAT